MKVYTLFMMGGHGSRFGSDIPKQFTMIENIPLFAYIVRKLSKQECINGIVIVVNPVWYDFTIEWIEKLDIGNIISVVVGGTTRSASVFNGLKALEDIADDQDIVLMHDATHPYVDQNGTIEVIKMIQEYGAATLVSLNYDTTYLTDDGNNIVEVVPRKNIVVGASPEGFKYKQIYNIYANATEADMETMTSVGAIAMKYNIPIKVVPTSILNLKITYPEDMKVLMALYKSYFFE